jgi:hypothetical protein
MSDFLFPHQFRDAMLAALPDDTSLHGSSPESAHIYLPVTHAKALHPNTMLVQGIRGAGKSFWWAVLQHPQHRAVIGKQVGLSKDTIVSLGFGEKKLPKSYPGKDTLIALLDKKIDPRRIWQAIAFYHFAGARAPTSFTAIAEWSGRIGWIKKHPEQVENLLFEIDNDLDAEQKYHLVLFDALDRTADEWPHLNALVRGLLQVVLDFRPYKRLRLKVFVRPDQLEDPTVTAFPDASKIMSQAVSLEWSRRDLYGLLWQYLANDVSSGKQFRQGCVKLDRATEWLEKNQVWLVPDNLRTDEECQKPVFHAITGPFMGKDRRRGFPYSWLPSHLADARGQVSPRSFLAALRHAANDGVRAGQEFALHYESIKSGVQEASKIRVQELVEDYPWINTLFTPLAGISVPCQFKDIAAVWKNKNALAGIVAGVMWEGVRLPPVHLHAGPKGVLQDLIALGLVEQLNDGRINLPDVYRVGYGMGRRGGVKPIKA